MEPISPNVTIDINVETGKKPNVVIPTDTEEKAVKRCVNITKVICILIFTVPLMVTDLYFGYSNQPCLSLQVENISFGIGTWLRVSGYIQLASTILLILAQFTGEDFSKIFSKLISYLFGLFFVAWSIVGSVIFWKYLEPVGACGGSLNAYLWARLIIGLVNAGCMMFVK